ncbi:MAG: T9SS type A sorting domain-containing protein [Bacteroidales bacterium]|nr:T9SS type A sorting domain-containing protein [Bacteroidales bacterium]
MLFYNFTLNSDTIIHDYSNFGEPVDLLVTERSKIDWSKSNRFEIKEGTAIKSLKPALKVVEACKQTNEITLECWIRPSFENSLENSKIVSISDTDDSVAIALMQNAFDTMFYDSYNYYVALSTKSTSANGSPYFSTDNDNKYITLHHLVYTKDSLGQEKFYLNGNLINENLKPNDLNWSEDMFLFLGSDHSGENNWKGTYYLLAIYSKALSISQVMKNFRSGPTDDLNKKSNDYQVKYYPNPATDKLLLEILPVEVNEMGDKSIIQILDLNGAVYYEEFIKDPNRTYSTSIDVNRFPKGFYFLRIVTPNNSQAHKLLVH